jgi:glucosylceramidase
MGKFYKIHVLIYLKTIIFLLVLISCNTTKNLQIAVYETSKNGNKLSQINTFSKTTNPVKISLDTSKTFQSILGFGGSFTESSAHVLNQLSIDNKQKIMNAYFSKEGANYSLTRTHIASCDFSLNNYTYAKKENDTLLNSFSVEEDKTDLIPLILEAKKISNNGFKIIASPWSCPPWMKNNNSFVGGKLLPKYYDTFALYFSKYLNAYLKEGIDLWGITVINEPHGNGNNWESTLFSPEEMTNFVTNYLGPHLEKENWKHIQILGYDQNRAGIKKWTDLMYKNKQTSKYFAGLAIHWYESTYEIFPENLQYAFNKATNKYIIQTEACIDSEIPVWKNDAWYWEKNATDWGWDWANENEKYLHPKYAAVNRYTNDIIGCLNNNVNGWIDWNIVLDQNGGPNWAKNWCIAPVIANVNLNEVYFTPLYYVMAHFSKFIRPNAKRIASNVSSDKILVTAFKNSDNTIALIIYNPFQEIQSIEITCHKKMAPISIHGNAIQTIVIKE